MNPKNKEVLKKSRVPEKDRLEDLVGYDRNFDPIAEAHDLAIAKKLESQKRQRL